MPLSLSEQLEPGCIYVCIGIKLICNVNISVQAKRAFSNNKNLSPEIFYGCNFEPGNK